MILIKRTIIYFMVAIFCLIAGYAFGYRNAFVLQNANLRSSEIAQLQMLHKLYEHLLNDDKARSKRLIIAVMKSEMSYIYSLSSLSKEANHLSWPRLSDIELVQNNLNNRGVDEEEVLSKTAELLKATTKNE